MTHHPYGPDELDRADAELDRVAHALEAHAAANEGQMPGDLPARIRAAIDRQPEPAVGWWAGLLAGPRSWNPAGRAMAAAAAVGIALVGTVALAGIVDSLRSDVGSSPPPSPIVSPSETATPTRSATPTSSPSPSPTPTPRVTPAPSPSETVAPTPVPATAVPTASDDDDDDETPEPSESDNSGPGGGGGGGHDD